MARIRTIKPEFPHSESIGRLSRDARLLFIQLWTIVDDAGRARAASRMLASLLYPYDDDAASLIGGWLDELEHEGCIRRYEVDGKLYLDIPKWLDHQKIDRPSKSHLPGFVEGSRGLVEGSRGLGEGSSGDLGPVPRTSTSTSKGRDRKGEGVANAALTRPPSDCDQAVLIWNEMASAVELPLVQRLTEPRRQRLKQRLAECGGLDGWRIACGKVRGSPFLCGENPRGWRADFDFVVRQSSFTKLMEGRYDDGNRGSGKYENGFAELLASGQLDGPGGD